MSTISHHILHPLQSVFSGYWRIMDNDLEAEKDAHGGVSHVTLGTPAAPYRTRYVIDHVTQRRPLCGEVVGEECAPCCVEGQRSSVGGVVWAFCRSEALLFSLHMLTILLGVIKEQVKNIKVRSLIFLFQGQNIKVTSLIFSF